MVASMFGFGNTLVKAPVMQTAWMVRWPDLCVVCPPCCT